MATRTQEALSAESMRRAVAEALGEDPGSIGEEEDLVRRGIDSIRVMRLASGWRRSGVDLTFAELIERPTLRAWWALASARSAAEPAAPEAAQIDEDAPFELAPMQRAYWIGRGDDQVLGGVGAHFYGEFDGEGIDPRRLDAALSALLGRHAMLRARVSEDGRQQVMAESPWRGVTVHDFRDQRPDQPAAGSAGLREALSARRLAVERGEVFDVQLSLHPGGATRLHVSIDMLVCDAQSFQVILGDLARLYLRPESELGPIRYSFARYLAERSRGRGDAHERAKAYWRGILDDLPGAPQLPLAVAPERLARHGTGRRFHWIPPGHRQRIEQRCRDHALTPSAVLATAFSEVLAAWSAEPRFLLNLPLFDREDLHPDVPRLVGDFTNLLILAVDVGEDLPFAEQARRLSSRLAAAAAHAEYSGVEVLRDLARARPGGAMLAPVVFTSVVGMGELFGPEVRRCFGTPTWTSSQTPQVWLDHQVTEQDGGLLFNWDVVEELFEAGVVDAMFHAYRHLLDWLVDPACSWDEPVPPLLPRTQAVVREAVNATAAPLPAGLLHDGFFVRAAASPDAVGVAWGERDRRTYGELRDGALRIGALLERHGVRPGDAVAVTLPRGPDQIAAVLGVLAAGAAYVPVGPDQPPRRRAEAYASARAAVVLTEFGAAPEWTGGAEAVPVHHARGVAPLPAPLRVPAESLAYVIFTSGSTGAPKGVEISHRAALNTIDDVNSRFGVGAGDAVLAVSALDFDLSVYDIFGLLSAGGTVVVPDEADRREARRWGELVRRWKVTIWNSVPALLDMLLVAAGRPEAPLKAPGRRPEAPLKAPGRRPEAPLKAPGRREGLGTSLRLALVSGDWVGLDLPPRLAAACPAARFVALGGATEAAIWSNSFEVEAVPPHWRSIPYGRPLRNQAYRVADLRGRDCPDWVPGELWIGGAGLADGYRGDPARTAERFVTHEGRRWYRTGDLGRYWPDATLEFLGRRDLQVKVRGHRVELGEIEAALRSHPDVGAAAAAVTGGPARRIAAAVVGRAGALDPEQLQSFLAERLPPYLLPGGLAVLDELPLTSNGKIDRAALARLVEVQEPEPGDEPPRGPIESGLARVWSELLGVAEVPRNRSFFALGGDSLIATRMVESLRDRFGVGVSLRRLFEAPTVAELAAVVASGRRELEEAEEGVV